MHGCRSRRVLTAVTLLAFPLLASAQNADEPKNEPAKLDTSRGDAMIADYFRRETAKIADACLADIQTAEDWNAKKDEYRRQLHEMLGLDPLPEKTDLKATITGQLDHEEFTVEKLHFQSRPGLYVTGNLYVPKVREGKVPAILYVCGHGNVKKDGISYGSKSHYQHHGAWFARNGYVCLVIDTLQLGEIEGIHHGTYRYNMWWWLNRGYTPAGVEAWNCVRALDYLQSRPEVDGEKLGVTGRSGGGAYSWWIAAIDERIKCAVPVAGITDLTNHVVDGCVEGHCDCMYMVNTYRWDYPQVAALVAPRPLLISNTDSDRIFPLDGVVRVFDKARRIYTLLGKRDQIGLNITSGGHLDTQELQVTAMRWFNHHLRGYDGPVTNHAERFFEPEQLKVFDKLPQDEINTKIHETFVAAARFDVPADAAGWRKHRDELLATLRAKCFGGWPESPPPLNVRKAFEHTFNGIRLTGFDFKSQESIDLRLLALTRENDESVRVVVLNPLSHDAWTSLSAYVPRAFSMAAQAGDFTKEEDANLKSLAEHFLRIEGLAVVLVMPRGIGPTAWDQSEKKQVQNRRRFMLLGQTLESMQAWDLRRAIQAVTEIDAFKNATYGVNATDAMVGVSLLALPFERDSGTIALNRSLEGLEGGPFALNLSRVLTRPQLNLLAAERADAFSIGVPAENVAAAELTNAVIDQIRWDGPRVRVIVEKEEKTEPAAKETK